MLLFMRSYVPLTRLGAPSGRITAYSDKSSIPSNVRVADYTSSGLLMYHSVGVPIQFGQERLRHQTLCKSAL